MSLNERACEDGVYQGCGIMYLTIDVIRMNRVCCM